MINKLISDIRQAIQDELYFAALNSALTLPDICGKAEYPSETSTKKRYIQWYDSMVGQYEKNPHNVDMPYLSGEIIYTLRCSLLHEGNPNIQNDKLRNDQPIDCFELVIESENRYQIYSDSSSIIEQNGNTLRYYRMSIRRVVTILCAVAEAYYADNKEKFHFNYRIIDWDKVTEMLPHPDVNEVVKMMSEL